MCLDALEELLKSQSVQAILTIPTGHNPLGFSMPENNRRHLANSLISSKFLLLKMRCMPNYNSPSLYYPTLRHLTKMDGFWSAATKTVAPDYRIGWLEAGRFRNIVQQLKFTTTVAEPALLTETLGLFLENGGYDLHLRQLKNAINNKLTPSNLIFVVISQSVLESVVHKRDLFYG
jgi:DNA-binding transcriptional MocR family regulator